MIFKELPQNGSINVAADDTPSFPSDIFSIQAAVERAEQESTIIATSHIEQRTCKERGFQKMHVSPTLQGVDILNSD